LPSGNEAKEEAIASSHLPYRKTASKARVRNRGWSKR